MTMEPLDNSHRIAMWSGPRNISTAMMRSFASRSDCVVVDEPLYAAYLYETGKDHPMRGAVIASQPTDWRNAMRRLMAPLRDGKTVQYQKHMTHHLLDQYTWFWLQSVQNCFLIRDPAEVLASYAAKWEDVKATDLGYHQQIRVYNWLLERTGKAPPVIDAKDILMDPAKALSGLCEDLGIRYEPSMLKWEAGRKPYDGVWAEHWYAAVEASTGFAPYMPKETEIPKHLQPVLDACRPLYDELRVHCRASGSTV